MFSSTRKNATINATVLAASLTAISDSSLLPQATAASDTTISTRNNLRINPPTVSKMRFVGANKNSELTFQNSSNVLSYNVFSASSLNGTNPLSSFSMVQSNISASASNTTTWQDSRSNTAEKLRYYFVQPNKVTMPGRMEISPAACNLNRLVATAKDVFITNDDDKALSWTSAKTGVWLNQATISGTIPSRKTALAADPYNLSYEWCQANDDWGYASLTDIAVRKDGKVFVVDHAQSAIRVFDASGALQLVFLCSGATSESHIGFDSDNNIFVTTGNGIAMYDPNGSFLRNIGVGTCGYSFDLAIDANNNIFVTDGGNLKVHKFSRQGALLASWGNGNGLVDGSFVHPSLMRGVMGIVVDAAGNVYVADNHYERLQKFDNNGNFIKSWRETDNVETDWQYGEALTIRNDGSGEKIYLAHEHSLAMKVFNTTLEQVGAHPMPFSLWGHVYMRDAAFDSSGNLYAISSYGGDVRRRSPDGSVTVWGNVPSQEFSRRFENSFEISSDGVVHAFGYTTNSTPVVSRYSARGQFLGACVPPASASRFALTPQGGYSFFSQGRIVFCDQKGKETGSVTNSEILANGIVPYCFGKQGDIFVLSSDTYSYTNFLNKLNKAGQITMSCPWPAGISNGEQIVSDGQGNLVVLARGPSYKSTILKYNEQGVLLGSWMSDDYLSDVKSISLDVSGNIFAATLTQMTKLSPNGDFLSQQQWQCAGPVMRTINQVRARVAPNGDLFCLSGLTTQMSVYSQAVQKITFSQNPSYSSEGINTATVNFYDSADMSLAPFSLPARYNNNTTLP